MKNVFTKEQMIAMLLFVFGFSTSIGAQSVISKSAERKNLSQISSQSSTTFLGYDNVPKTMASVCSSAVPITVASFTNQSLVCSGSNNIFSGNVLNFCAEDTVNGGTISTGYTNGREALYSYVPSTDGTVNITIDNSSWTAIFVYLGCPSDGGSCVAATRSPQASRSLSFQVTAGVEYFIWVDSFLQENPSPCAEGGTMTFSGPEPGEINPCIPNSSYRETFESAQAPALPECTSVETVIGNTWEVVATPAAGFDTKHLVYNAHTSSDANAWFFTKGVKLEAGKKYEISYDYGTGMLNETLKIAYGKANTSTAMSEALAQHINFSTGNVLESNNVVFEPSESGTYFFGIQAASNANAGALRIDNISVKEQVVLGNYCIPSLDCTDGDVINNVSFIDIDNTSTCGLGGYGDYTSISTNAEIGKSYPISVTVGNGFAFESVMLWIDFNKNGVFEENEYTYLGTATASSGTTIYSTVSIPGGLEPGERRMRLRVLPAGMSETKWDRACDDTIEKYGEVEDYTINLVDAAPKGCLSGMFGQMPSTIFEPLCDNQAQEIPVDVYAGSYTKVAVKTGVEYVFSSSRDTDFITIGNESGTLVITSGNGSVTWTSNVTGIVRFYTHSDENCNMDGVAMKRFVKCGESALPNNDTCDTAIALSNGDTIIGSTKLATDTVLESAPDLFYTYTGNGNPELVTISLCGSSFDTFLGAYISCDASVFTEITSNDNFCGDQSQITFLSNGYSTYVIVIDGKNGESGDFVLNVSSELVKNPTSCEDYSIQGNNQFGISFGGDFQQKNAIDLPIGATDITFYGMQPVLATGATQINFNIYEDDRGLPGMLIDTKEGTIVNKELYSVLLGLNFDRYTVQFKTPFVAKANKTYWIEVVTDAVGWEVTDVVENSVGNNDAFANANTNFQWQSQNGVHFVFSMLCKDLLSTNDFANQQFSFYPNPVENFLNITSKETIRKVDVYNIQGQKVLNNVKFENGKLNVSSLLKGNYLLQIFFDNGNVETAKIIKK